MPSKPPERSDSGPPRNLDQVLDRIEAAAAGEGPVTLGDILDEIGHRSFGVWIAVAGIITAAPLIGDIPGVPTLVAVFVFLTALQLLMRRRHTWLPQWLIRRSVQPRKITRGMGWMRKPARFVDRFLRPRLTGLVEGPGLQAVAAACLAIALLMPAMEVVPFSANGAGAGLTAFGLALIARDGILALVAYGFTALTFAVLAVVFF